jgi:hypothetical protein
VDIYLINDYQSTYPDGFYKVKMLYTTATDENCLTLTFTVEAKKSENVKTRRGGKKRQKH